MKKILKNLNKIIKNINGKKFKNKINKQTLKIHPKNPGDNSEPPHHFHRFRIILESGDTIVYPHTNQEPTFNVLFNMAICPQKSNSFWIIFCTVEPVNGMISPSSPKMGRSAGVTSRENGESCVVLLIRFWPL